MIHEVSGDILLTKAQAIAHGIAPNDHFDQGLALALRERWPAMVKDFRHFAKEHHPKPGSLWAWGGFGIRIFNLLTQEGDQVHGARPGRATVSHVHHCLRELEHAIEKEGVTSLALPKLACGVGGLDWAEVKPQITSHLGKLNIPVFVYAEFHKGVAAKEPGV